VEFDVAIGLLHLQSFLRVAHDGGHMTISYAGVQGRFYVFKGLRANMTMGPYGYIYV
jgi:hypothetical protein